MLAEQEAEVKAETVSDCDGCKGRITILNAGRLACKFFTSGGQEYYPYSSRGYQLHSKRQAVETHWPL